MKFLINAIKEVFGERKYKVISIVAIILMYIANPIIYNYKLISSKFSLILPLIFSFHKVPAPAALVFIILSSILAGIIIAMSIFLIRRQIKGGMITGSSGIIVGLIAPACPSCALGLLSVIGLSGLVAVLPFKGLELGFLGVILLLASIIYLSNKINTKVCKI
tara:strand:- start:22636 stop:23124 length:489 start_codon:yes stop_codon:yes gene_type:complete